MSDTNPASPSSELASSPLRGGRPQRMRWLVPPVMAAVLVGVVGLVPRLAGAQSRPKLAPLSPAALIAKVEAAKVSVLSGTVESKPNLGLPNLSSLDAMGGGATTSGGEGTSGASGSGGSGSGASGAARSGDAGSDSAAVTSLVTSLLTAPQTAQVFYDGPGHVRVAVAQGQGETDLIRNGSDVWLWQSKSQQVTQAVLGAHPASAPSSGVQPSARALGAAVPLTPQDVANRLLSSLDPSTRVFVLDTAYVAGRSAYELVLAPRSPQSLISDVVMAVDAATGLPLRVQVVSRSSTTPALELGFTSISFARPAASNFAFSPPPGAKVDTVTPGDKTPPGPGGAKTHHHAGPSGQDAKAAASTAVVGTGWDSIGVVRGVDLSNPRLATLLRTATPVSGAWGSGKLFTTSLADALVLPNGTVLVGAVTPRALESAVASAR